MFVSKRTLGKLLLLSVEEIHPSPYQARSNFDQGEIDGLALSIQQNGLLQPISVRRDADFGGYELLAGERRLRACKQLAMRKIPAILCEYQDEQSASLSLLENLQRQDLNPFEQARGIKALIAIWGCTQNDAAHRLGMAQPTLANKLRLLQLSDELQTFVVAQGLNERHARAVLRLPDPMRKSALLQMYQQQMNAKAADDYVEQLLKPAKAKPKPRRALMVRDVRIFVNTINRAISLMTESGVPATSKKTEGEGYIEYTVRIPTAGAARQ